MPLTTPEVIDRYQVLKSIGEGGRFTNPNRSVRDTPVPAGNQDAIEPPPPFGSVNMRAAMGRHRELLVAVAALALSAIAVSARTSRWADPYQKGVKAIDAKQWEAAVAILEPALASARSPGVAAYLGVASATLALSSVKPDEQKALNRAALDQFVMALAMRRDYQLSARLVSPKILDLFEQARALR